MTPISTFESFGAWLKKRRKQLDLTQEQLGALSGCSGAAIRKFEADERKPSRELAELLARALKIPDTEQDQFIKLARGFQPRDRFTDKLESLVIDSYFQPPDNLPSPLTSLVDRVNDVAAVAKMISDPDIRWVTLIGPPGIGKTRLSIQSARYVLANFVDGVWFVDLAPLEQASHVLPAIVRALEKLGVQPSSALDQLAAALKNRSLLLVLDNFEHVTDAATEIAALLKTCAGVKVLATSRIPLNVYGEHEYRVPALSIPPADAARDPEKLLAYESVQLFVARTRQHQRDFTITAENAPLIIEVCTTLEGMPLALELAAASLKRMSIIKIGEVLHHMETESWLRLFSAPARDLPARQHTLENVVAWSYTLLTSPQQDLFCKLGMFSGWFDLDSVLAICFNETHITQSEVRDLLDALAQHSLLEQGYVENIPYWRMLEVIHEYAVLRLEPNIRENLSVHYANYFFEKLQLAGSGDQHLVNIHVDNFHAAMKYYISHQQTELGFQMAARLEYLWLDRGYYREGIDLLNKLFALPDMSSPETRADRLQAAADLAWQVHEFDTSLSFARAAAELGQEYNLPEKKANYLNRLGRINIESGHYPEARNALEECLALANQNPSAMNPGVPLAQLGELAFFEGRLEDGQVLLEHALELLTEQDAIFIAIATVDLVEIAIAREDLSLALFWLKRAYPYAKIHIRRSIIFLCAAAGYLAKNSAGNSDDLIGAVNLFGAIENLSDKTGVQLGAFYIQLNQKRIRWIRGQISDVDWTRHHLTGAQWNEHQALSKAAEFLRIK